MNPNNDQKNRSRDIKTSRRNFLKKAAYSAPTIVAMGGLLRPTQAKAWGRPEDVPSQPAGL